MIIVEGKIYVKGDRTNLSISGKQLIFSLAKPEKLEIGGDVRVVTNDHPIQFDVRCGDGKPFRTFLTDWVAREDQDKVRKFIFKQSKD